MNRSKTAGLRAAVAATVLAAAAAGTFATATAQAATAPLDDCSQAAPARQDNPYTTTHTAVNAAPLRMGPYGTCHKLQTYAQGSSITVRCYITNSYGNTWSYEPGAGWIWDGHLSGGGSPYPCVF
ncbi:hypothetical protein [Streptomyces sp. NPDC048603]|uniref:hypothetical protein n=1 Tax=Streptomyces sp. NPDC048603 TaxID=3365577 RepID=UPI0037196E6C